MPRFRPLLKLAAGLALAMPASLSAQPADLPLAPAQSTELPAGVTIAETVKGRVYATRGGVTLYGMDMRTLLRWSPDPAQHCTGACAEKWEPLLAPADARPNIRYPKGFGDRGAEAEGFVKPQEAPDWTVIAGPQGPQWVFKGWHMVFTRRGSPPGSTAHDGEDDHVWNTLKYVPPRPQLVGPAQVVPVFAGGDWLLADREGRILFTGQCRRDCADWLPLPAGMANRGLGRWRIDSRGDAPRWLYRGKGVFVSPEADPATIPPGGTALRP